MQWHIALCVTICKWWFFLWRCEVLSRLWGGFRKWSLESALSCIHCRCLVSGWNADHAMILHTIWSSHHDLFKTFRYSLRQVMMRGVVIKEYSWDCFVWGMGLEMARPGYVHGHGHMVGHRHEQHCRTVLVLQHWLLWLGLHLLRLGVAAQAAS